MELLPPQAWLLHIWSLTPSPPGLSQPITAAVRNKSSPHGAHAKVSVSNPVFWRCSDPPAGATNRYQGKGSQFEQGQGLGSSEEMSAY